MAAEARLRAVKPERTNLLNLMMLSLVEGVEA
jgi:hypothetical protein